MNNKFRRLRFLTAIWILLIHCTNPDSSNELNYKYMFSPSHVIDVEIEIDGDDWNILRYEGRGLTSVFSGCDTGYEYTYFNATVTIDGKKLENVAIRKKGFMGSLSAINPSFKLNFDMYTPGRTYIGMKRMTLNNDRQDPSHTHQIMSYALFRKAGVPAPRCNLARVSVNGNNLGIYSNVESIKRPFLSRHFEDDTGNLYEGQLADFTPELVSNFEFKTTDESPTEPDRSDLDRVVSALQVEDSQLVAALEQVIDLDAFITFWAMEVLVGHWDGYNGNRNNYYIYNDPITGLFNFIPWGTDAAFGIKPPNMFAFPESVYAVSKLSNRLYNNSETKTLYLARLKYLLDNVWDENALFAEFESIKGIILPDSKEALNEHREFLLNRKDAIQDELDNGGGVWSVPYYSIAKECIPSPTISGTFRTTWEYGAIGTDDNQPLTLIIDDETQDFTETNSIAGIDNIIGMNEDTAMFLFSTTGSDGSAGTLMLFVPLVLMQTGEVPFHGMETYGMFFESLANPMDAIFIGDGAITFDAVGTNPGNLISGSFSGLMNSMLPF